MDYSYSFGPVPELIQATATALDGIPRELINYRRSYGSNFGEIN